jgi:hypothetical protein
LSDFSQGAGWWLASDGKWYSPEQRPGVSQVTTQAIPQGGYPQVPPQRTTSGSAVASLILSIVWVGGLGSLLAVILGFIARNEIKRSNGSKSGEGMALAGIIIGFLGLAGIALLIVLVVALGTAANTIVQDLQPKTVAFGTTINVSNSTLNPGIASITVYSLAQPRRVRDSLSGTDYVATARMQVCADSSGSQQGFDAVDMNVYFVDGQIGTPNSTAIVRGAGRNLTELNSLAASQCVSGYVPFDVAKGTTPLGVSYTTDFFRTINWTH